MAVVRRSMAACSFIDGATSSQSASPNGELRSMASGWLLA
jgi:hypothetical protein